MPPAEVQASALTVTRHDWPGRRNPAPEGKRSPVQSGQPDERPIRAGYFDVTISAFRGTACPQSLRSSPEGLQAGKGGDEVADHPIEVVIPDAQAVVRLGISRPS